MGSELFAYRAIIDQDGKYISPSEAEEKLDRGELDRLEYPRTHFNDVFQAHISLYILINGEDWN